MILRSIRCGVVMAKQNLKSVYPFEYTFYPDSRLEEFPVLQKLYPAQHEHVKYVLNSFQLLLNKGVVDKAAKQFVAHPLILLAYKYRSYLGAESANIKFHLHGQTFNQSLGYLEYYGFNPSLFIHQYTIDRKDQKIKLTLKQQLAQTTKKSSQQQLKQDIEDIQKDNSLGEKLKEKIFKDKFKKSQGVIKIWDFFENSYRKSKQVKKFEEFYLVNKIDGKASIKIDEGSKKQHIQDYNFTTKWFYNVTSEQPESIRKSRKRVLFDVQLWNRGCLIPVKDFTLD